ncbi:MAG: pilus assembly protein [Bacteroidetes bacterium QS_3_64_15]|nr:MAG: pilus assembly protein [Bacteroidetes bacterium QS_3_64_15]
MTTLLDTGPLVSVLNRRDTHHQWASYHAGRRSAPFLTCEAVLSEAHFLLQDAPGGRSRLIEIMTSDRMQVSFAYADHASRVQELMRTYSDLPMSFADACLVRMAELHDDGRVFTVDGDFRIYRKHGSEPIPVLMPGGSEPT